MNDVWSRNSLKLDGSRVIDRSIYVDPAIFEAEHEKIFAGTWQWVAHESELRAFGDYITATIAGRPIVVSRGKDDRITAFFNTCTHRGAVLAPHPRGNNAGSFVCFYHAWCFNSEGKFTSAPIDAAYGGGFNKDCYNIPTIRHEIYEGSIFVTLDSSIDSLHDYLGAAGAYITQFTGRHEVLGRVRWLLKGNWKLWHENFRDNYHPMFTHMVVGASYQGVNIEGINVDLSGGHSLLAFPSQGNPDRVRAAIRRVTGKPLDSDTRRTQAGAQIPSISESAHSHYIMAIFPNLDFQNFAGGGVNVLQFVRPLTVDKAVVEIVAFGEVGELMEARQARLDHCLDGQTSAGKISGDDTEAARRCSVGFGTLREVRWSNIDRGQAAGKEGSKNDEYSLRAFYHTYKKYMGQSLAP